jgi:hypothetical protein
MAAWHSFVPGSIVAMIETHAKDLCMKTEWVNWADFQEIRDKKPVRV